MIYALCRTWAAAVCLAAVCASSIEGSRHSQRIVRPVSYTYYSANVRNPEWSRVGLQQRPPFDTETGVPRAIPADNVRLQSLLAPHQDTSISRRTVRFPLNTVLPANSLRFDHKPYPGLLQAVNIFSDLTPLRMANESVLVTHNAVSLPATNEGVTTASRTRITNVGIGSPYTEFTETTHNTQGDRGSVIERTQHLLVHQNIDDTAAESHILPKTGGGANDYESEQGEAEEEAHHETKGGSGEKVYKKDEKHHKEAKGYHDKERDTSSTEESLKKERELHRNEKFFGEHRKAEKGGNEKKYGGGGKHKRGHTTRGEHNIVKKDEFIKNTKFYDENHGGGEHEETGEVYSQHEEKNGRTQEGEKRESDYEKKEEEKTSRDKGHEEENHGSRKTGSGRQEHSEREEEYGGKKGEHTFKKWDKNGGDHH